MRARVTWRPTTWSSRPRRTTSTSGSSGTGGSGLRRTRGGRRGGGAAAVVERVPRLLGGLLLGFLLRATASLAEDLLADDDAGAELLLVVGPLLADAVLGPPQRRAGRHLLQARLPVESGPERGGLLDERVEVVVHEAGGEVDVGRQEHRADERLEGVGQDRGLVAAARGLLALAEHDVLPEVEDPGDVGDRPAVADVGAQLGQLPL